MGAGGALASDHHPFLGNEPLQICSPFVLSISQGFSRQGEPPPPSSHHGAAQSLLAQCPQPCLCCPRPPGHPGIACQGDWWHLSCQTRRAISKAPLAGDGWSYYICTILSCPPAKFPAGCSGAGEGWASSRSAQHICLAGRGRIEGCNKQHSMAKSVGFQLGCSSPCCALPAAPHGQTGQQE